MARIVLDDDSELDEYVRRYLEDCVQRHVRAILEHQLKNVVAGELARLKLSDPNSHGVGEQVDAILENRLRNAANRVVPDTVKALMREHFKNASQQLANL